MNYYWDIIDWNSFWFYEEEGLHKYGGVTEWAIRNFDINDEILDDKFNSDDVIKQSEIDYYINKIKYLTVSI